jgi:hypothetical protein
MTVFTIFFCGTGSTKYDSLHENYWNGELVSTLADNMGSREFADWVVINGPGSGNLQADELFTEPKGYGWTGAAFGKGWHENVQHALNLVRGKCDWQRTKLTEAEYVRLKNAGLPVHKVEETDSWLWRHYDYGDRKVTQQQLQEQIIKTHRKGGVIPSQINLVGWSRGGVSCHMLANALLVDPALRKIPVNIFAIDPVPGPLNSQLEKITLSSNVKQYVAFYARDERSKGFACVIPDTPPTTQVSIFPMAGRHATLVGNASLTGASGPGALNEPGILVRHYAERCLTRWGAQLTKTLNLSDQDVSRLHQSTVMQDSSFLKMRDQSYVKITENTGQERSVTYKGKTVAFGKVSDHPFNPIEGLAATLAKGNSAYQAILK